LIKKLPSKLIEILLSSGEKQYVIHGAF
jgi:hypothetical protein